MINARRNRVGRRGCRSRNTTANATAAKSGSQAAIPSTSRAATPLKYTRMRPPTAGPTAAQLVMLWPSGGASDAVVAIQPAAPSTAAISKTPLSGPSGLERHSAAREAIEQRSDQHQPRGQQPVLGARPGQPVTDAARRCRRPARGWRGLRRVLHGRIIAGRSVAVHRVNSRRAQLGQRLSREQVCAARPGPSVRSRRGPSSSTLYQ